MNSKKHYPLVASLYINYLFQGIAAIVISQNKSIFQSAWGASLSQVSLVISAIGLGRIISLSFSGYFSDRVGRKPAVLVGAVSYFIFYLGIWVSPNYWIAFIFTLFAGVGNAFLDTATYPTVVELFSGGTKASSLSILNKAFISVGQFIFPLMMSFILTHKIYFGWSIVFCLVGVGLNLLYLIYLPFPQVTHGIKKVKVSNVALKNDSVSSSPQSKIAVEGVALMIFSFVSVSLFNIFTLWIPTYAEQILKISEAQSLTYVSLYSICSFLSVFMTATIVKKGASIPKLILFCCFMTALGLIIMLCFPSTLTVLIASCFVGVFSAGGIWQLGLLLLLEFFPGGKGVLTGYYSLATSISVMITPYLTGLMAEYNITSVFVYNVFLALLGSASLIVITYRYQKVVTPIIS